MEEFSGNTGLDLSMGKVQGGSGEPVILTVFLFLLAQDAPSAWDRRRRSRMCPTRQVTIFSFHALQAHQLIRLLSSPGLRYKNLGKSGLRVSNVALGTWTAFSNGVTEEQAETIIKLAYESGINLFDLSDLHSGPRAELEMGNILKKMNWKRITYVVTVKIYWSIK